MMIIQCFACANLGIRHAAHTAQIHVPLDAQLALVVECVATALDELGLARGAAQIAQIHVPLDAQLAFVATALGGLGFALSAAQIAQIHVPLDAQLALVVECVDTALGELGFARVSLNTDVSISLNTDVDLDVAAAVSIIAAVSAAKRPASRKNEMTGTRSDDLKLKFEECYAHLQNEKLWAWLKESDNATHFKSKENLNFWSERPSQEHCNFQRTVWVEYGCPGHGKGPRDGPGATAKTKVTTDITDGNRRTPSGKITCDLMVAQHLRAVFDSQEWMSVHMDMKINLFLYFCCDFLNVLDLKSSHFFQKKIKKISGSSPHPPW